MSRVRVACGEGVLAGEDRGDWLERVAERVRAAASRGEVLSERVESGDDAVWLKGDHLPGAARVRHSLRRACGLAVPALNEFRNLEWLRKRLFRVPEPLAAAAWLRGPLVGYQVLVTRALVPHVSLDEALRSAEPAKRDAWLDELAREVARMHSLHFVHRDLFLRNVLVAVRTPASGDPRALRFVDCRRGGAALPWRGESYDLGCLMLEGAAELDANSQRRFFELYFAERDAQGSPADSDSLLRGANAARAAWIERLARDPERLRGRAMPPRDWNALAVLTR